ncbi:hypothetical protein V8E53_014846 [Lactarius tabidus]
MQFLYSFHAILIVVTPCHSSLFIFFLVCCSLSLSLVSVGKCSVDFVLANLFSDLSLTPPVFHALNALLTAALMLAFAPFPLSIPRIALYVVVLVLHLHPPPPFSCL